jgi:glycine oxidase
VLFLVDFLIVGAGVSGLLVARELLAEGASVCLIDRGQSGKEASWAGGGIVSPLYPWRYCDAVTALASQAQSVYPELTTQLLAETGIDPEYRACGLLMLETHDRQQALDWSQRHNRDIRAWGEKEIYARESGLAPGSLNAMWMPSVANVRNPRLLQALRASILGSAAAELREQCEFVSLVTKGSEVIGAQVNNAGRLLQLNAGRIIVTAGAWAGQLIAAMPSADPVQIEPVKGEMLLYRTKQPLLRSIVLSAGRYLIPREDNLILVGSTLEYCGFDKASTKSARLSLSDSAVSLLPALQEAEVVAQWAGLRPGSPGGVPFIGKIRGLENVYINAGHFRNGLVLAPASARLLVDIMLGRKLAIDPSPYDPALDRQSSSFGS